MDGKLIKRLIELNTKDCLWIYILKILSKKPLHAYSIRKAIKDEFGFLSGNVTAYRVLYYLMSQGYVKKNTEGRRKVYSITEGGLEELGKAIDFYKKRVEILKND